MVMRFLSTAYNQSRSTSTVRLQYFTIYCKMSVYVVSLCMVDTTESFYLLFYTIFLLGLRFFAIKIKRTYIYSNLIRLLFVTSENGNHRHNVGRNNNILLTTFLVYRHRPCGMSCVLGRYLELSAHYENNPANYHRRKSKSWGGS